MLQATKSKYSQLDLIGFFWTTKKKMKNVELLVVT